MAVTTTAKAAASSVAVVVGVALAAATSLAVALKVKVMAVLSRALMTVALTTVKTTALKPLVATAPSHAKARLAETLVRAVVSQNTVGLKVVAAHHEATLAKAKAHHAVTSVPHAASMTVHPHVAHAPHLKQVARPLTNLVVQPVVSRLVAVLMRRNAHPSLAHLVN